jgi:dTDP-4-dehydrorhamnose 3,5-epimerase
MASTSSVLLPKAPSPLRRIETPLPGVWILEPQVFGDDRGFFFESYHEGRFREIGITSRFVQDNHSRSVKGTLRGLHYQLRHPQAKLCRVVQGEVLDVVVDIRRGSPHFGEWCGVNLSGENKRQVYIPRGFAHGFRVLSETADFLYKCDDFYYADDEFGIAWDDPGIGIQWNVDGPPVLSRKDRQNPTLATIDSEALPIFEG